MFHLSYNDLAATEFKEKFDECAMLMGKADNNEDKLAEDLSALKVKDEKDGTEEGSPKENGNTESSENKPESTTETSKSATDTTETADKTTAKD